MFDVDHFNCTKIVCTLGPASSDEKMIEELAKAGMSIARLNFSHGDHAFHDMMIKKIRRVSKKLGKPLAILQDLCGPKIRVGRVRDGAIVLTAGSMVTLFAEDIVGDEKKLSVSPPELLVDLKAGESVLINDGMIKLEVVKAGAKEVTAKVIIGGEVKDHKGMNLPGAVLSLPSLTPKDLDDLKFGIESNVDFVALSFVRSAQDVHRLKAEIKKLNAETPVIAKLEKPQAIKHLGEIMNVADGVMVARGDLGVEMPLEEVPIIQKNIITVAKEYHKPVITATQMLESMTQNQTPTRAEVSDVANAIFDGTDCVMLSGETASGLYPVEAVKMMSRIIRTTEEKTKLQPPQFDIYGSVAVEFADAVAEAAIEMGKDIDARVIACFTQSGLTARLISKHRSSIPIVAFTPRRDIINRLVLLRGVVPHYIPIQKSVDTLINEVERIFKAEKVAKIGDNIVIVASAPISVRGDTNMLKLHTIT